MCVVVLSSSVHCVVVRADDWTTILISETCSSQMRAIGHSNASPPIHAHACPHPTIHRSIESFIWTVVICVHLYVHLHVYIICLHTWRRMWTRGEYAGTRCASENLETVCTHTHFHTSTHPCIQTCIYSFVFAHCPVYTDIRIHGRRIWARGEQTGTLCIWKSGDCFQGIIRRVISEHTRAANTGQTSPLSLPFCVSLCVFVCMCV